MIVFNCGQCGHEIKTDDFMAGGEGTCPGCQAMVHVPESSPAAGKPDPVRVPASSKKWTPGFVPRGERGEHRCPKCTARISPGDSECGYCHQALVVEGASKGSSPPTRRAAAVPPSARGTLIKLGLSLGFLIAGLILINSASSETEVPSPRVCASNLTLLYLMISDRIEDNVSLPKAKGKAFWVDLVGKGGDRTTIVCEEAVRRGIGMRAVYRGPREALESLADDAPIACDPPGIHEGGACVLYKNGTVTWVEKDTEEYSRAVRETAE